MTKSFSLNGSAIKRGGGGKGLQFLRFFEFDLCQFGFDHSFLKLFYIFLLGSCYSLIYGKVFLLQICINIIMFLYVAMCINSMNSFNIRGPKRRFQG